MDHIDKKILEILQRSARVTNVQLAQAVALSPPAVIERVKKLEEKGIIRQYVAIVDEKKVGKSTQSFVAVSLEFHEPSSIENFTRSVMECPAILECYHLAGEDDYMLKVLSRDVAEYESFLLDTLTRIPGVRKVRTLFILSTVKKETEIPLDHLDLLDLGINVKSSHARERKSAREAKPNGAFKTKNRTKR